MRESIPILGDGLQMIICVVGEIENPPQRVRDGGNSRVRIGDADFIPVVIFYLCALQAWVKERRGINELRSIRSIQSCCV